MMKTREADRLTKVMGDGGRGAGGGGGGRGRENAKKCALGILEST